MTGADLLRLADEIRGMAGRVGVIYPDLQPWPGSQRDGANAYLILREWEEELREDALVAQASEHAIGSKTT